MHIRQTEFQILDVLWTEGEMTAGQLCRVMQNKIAWKRSTTYTVLKKCVEKGFIEREGSNFLCKPMISREEVQQAKIKDLIHLFFADSEKDFLGMIKFLSVSRT